MRVQAGNSSRKRSNSERVSHRLKKLKVRKQRKRQSRRERRTKETALVQRSERAKLSSSTGREDQKKYHDLPTV